MRGELEHGLLQGAQVPYAHLVRGAARRGAAEGRRGGAVRWGAAEGRRGGAPQLPRPLATGDERTTWFQRGIDVFPPYAEYREKAGDREIPVFIADPPAN